MRSSSWGSLLHTSRSEARNASPKMFREPLASGVMSTSLKRELSGFRYMRAGWLGLRSTGIGKARAAEAAAAAAATEAAEVVEAGPTIEAKSFFLPGDTCFPALPGEAFTVLAVFAAVFDIPCNFCCTSSSCCICICRSISSLARCCSSFVRSVIRSRCASPPRSPFWSASSLRSSIAHMVSAICACNAMASLSTPERLVTNAAASTSTTGTPRLDMYWLTSSSASRVLRMSSMDISPCSFSVALEMRKASTSSFSTKTEGISAYPRILATPLVTHMIITKRSLKFMCSSWFRSIMRKQKLILSSLGSEESRARAPQKSSEDMLPVWAWSNFIMIWCI
mmetsp:Transcript_23116/g.52335  ORF Transcript_23116/g.52335 Transcript_23116/m.52335 type:complete len:338 (+) Transcript_23116:588-1601(+)